MALSYFPPAGQILLCDYNSGFVAPEMVKRRPIVIVSPRLRRRVGLVTVVPLSTTPPPERLDYVCELELDVPLPAPFDAKVMWAKCDMISAVALTRLDRFRARRGPARHYVVGQLTSDQLAAVRRAVTRGIGLP